MLFEKCADPQDASPAWLALPSSLSHPAATTEVLCQNVFSAKPKHPCSVTSCSQEGSAVRFLCTGIVQVTCLDLHNEASGVSVHGSDLPKLLLPEEMQTTLIVYSEYFLQGAQGGAHPSPLLPLNPPPYNPVQEVRL